MRTACRPATPETRTAFSEWRSIAERVADGGSCRAEAGGTKPPSGPNYLMAGLFREYALRDHTFRSGFATFTSICRVRRVGSGFDE
jgi:hypothetical protein